MKKTILSYGAIAGAIIGGSIIIGAYSPSQAEEPQFSRLFGYLIMIVALSCIFVGIKRYRDRELGGVIRFGTAFLLGLGITAGVSGAKLEAEVADKSTVGLFQGMFERSILTFNPGWDAGAQRLEGFTDVREIQRHLKEQGLNLTSEADESTTGPASLTLSDPDGNPVLIDQHTD